MDEADEDKVWISVERDGVAVPVELGVPRYTVDETVSRRMRRAIALGVLQPGDEFAAGQLGTALGVGRIAASAGLEALKNEEKVSVRKGSGWRVV